MLHEDLPRVLPIAAGLVLLLLVPSSAEGEDYPFQDLGEVKPGTGLHVHYRVRPWSDEWITDLVYENRNPYPVVLRFDHVLFECKDGSTDKKFLMEGYHEIGAHESTDRKWTFACGSKTRDAATRFFIVNARVNREGERDDRGRGDQGGGQPPDQEGQDELREKERKRQEEEERKRREEEDEQRRMAEERRAEEEERRQREEAERSQQEEAARAERDELRRQQEARQREQRAAEAKRKRREEEQRRAEWEEQAAESTRRQEKRNEELADATAALIMSDGTDAVLDESSSWHVRAWAGMGLGGVPIVTNAVTSGGTGGNSSGLSGAIGLGVAGGLEIWPYLGKLLEAGMWLELVAGGMEASGSTSYLMQAQGGLKTALGRGKLGLVVVPAAAWTTAGTQLQTYSNGAVRSSIGQATYVTASLGAGIVIRDTLLGDRIELTAHVARPQLDYDRFKRGAEFPVILRLEVGWLNFAHQYFEYSRNFPHAGTPEHTITEEERDSLFVVGFGKAWDWTGARGGE